MNNLEKFNELSAEVFSRLHEAFPVGIDIGIEDYPAFNTEETSDIFFGTIRFYIDEGFIRCKKIVYGAFLGVRLTSKGFSVLNADPPGKISSESNIASALKTAAKTGSSELIKTLISEAIKLGIRSVVS